MERADLLEPALPANQCQPPRPRLKIFFLFSQMRGAACKWASVYLCRLRSSMPNWLIQGTEVGQVRFMLVGLALMLLMIYRPQGIFGDKRELALDAR